MESLPAPEDGKSPVAMKFECFFYSNRTLIVLGRVNGPAANRAFIDAFADRDAAGLAGITFGLSCGDLLHGSR